MKGSSIVSKSQCRKILKTADRGVEPTTATITDVWWSEGDESRIAGVYAVVGHVRAKIKMNDLTGDARARLGHIIGQEVSVRARFFDDQGFLRARQVEVASAVAA